MKTMRVEMRVRALALAATAMLAACSEHDEPVTAPAGDAVTVRVMSFNIEWGGTNVSFDNVAEAIRRAQPDVVGIQEAEGNLARLAGELGWQHAERSYVISRLPLIEPPGADGRYVFVEVRPGKVVAIGNVHLPSDPYGPYAVQNGATPEAVMALERRVRLPYIQPELQVLPPLARQGMPVFVTGDFNAPSYTDWTAATLGQRASVRYPLQWPVSRAMADAGFHDSWRTRWPDPVSHPGLTWWAARPPIPDYVIADSEPQDRIDYVWFAGPATVVSSEIVGEPGAPEVSISVTPWPSDHRGVVSAFTVSPAPVPELVTTDRRVYRQGDAIEVRHFLSRPGEVAIAVADLGADGAAIVTRTVAGNGRLTLPAGRFGAGHYELRALTRDTGGPLPPREFWVLARDATASISVPGKTFRPGEAIDIEWRNAPGNRNDYIAVYAAGEQPSGDGDPLWLYVEAQPAGTLQLNADTAGERWPLPPGDYRAWLMRDDGYDALAAPAAFHIEASR